MGSLASVQHWSLRKINRTICKICFFQGQFVRFIEFSLFCGLEGSKADQIIQDTVKNKGNLEPFSIIFKHSLSVTAVSWDISPIFFQ